MAKKMSWYEILGVPEDASQEYIKKTYRKLAKQYHPDVCSSPNAEKDFKKIQKDYETLIDPNRRKRYDKALHKLHERKKQQAATPEKDRKTSSGGVPGKIPHFRLFAAAAFLFIVIVAAWGLFESDLFNDESEDLFSQVESPEETINRLTLMIEDSQKQIKDLKADKKRLREDLAYQENEFKKSLDKQINALKNENARLKEKLADAEKQIRR